MLALALALLLPPLPGDEPPPGLPWIRTYAEAVQQALTKAQPVVIYFTKTY